MLINIDKFDQILINFDSFWHFLTNFHSFWQYGLTTFDIFWHKWIREPLFLSKFVKFCQIFSVGIGIYQRLPKIIKICQRLSKYCQNLINTYWLKNNKKNHYNPVSLVKPKEEIKDFIIIDFILILIISY